MYEKQVKIELFMIEKDDEFEEKSLRGKMLEVIKCSAKELRNGTMKTVQKKSLQNYGMILKSK
jgi:hypothetical protein